MGKHDKTTMDSFTEARIQELENRLAFAEENNRKLTEEIQKYGAYLTKESARINDILKQKDVEIAKLKETIIRLAVN